MSKTAKFTFEARKSKLLKNKDSKLRIDLVKDKESNLFIGYCISTINKEQVGEIDSLFVDAKYRKFGLGHKLITKALEWLDDSKVKTKVITVAEGNEEVLDFYKRYGFYKRRIVLEQI